MTVELQIKRKPYWHASYDRTMHLKRSLPFFRTGQGNYVHRVRFGHVHFRDTKARHTSLIAWCGQIGFTGNTAKTRPSDMFDVPPDTSVMCATCEGRAIGAGQTESRLICGRVVKFSPRT